MSRAILLGAILLGAAALRFWGIGHGLPFTMGRPDEIEALVHTAGFPSGDLNPRWFVYPNLFFWIVWLWTEGVLAVRRLFLDTPGYADLLAGAPATIILYGRLLSALLGTATVGVVWALGRRAGGAATGLVAATLLAGCFLHVRDSHALKADVFLTFAFPLALWTIARYAERPDARRGAVAGAVIGIATGLKYPGVVLLPVAYVPMVARSTRRGLARLLPPAHGWVLVLVAVGTFLLACPYLLIDRTRLADTFTHSVQLVYGIRPEAVPRSGDIGPALYLATRTFGYHVAMSLRHGCGLAMTLATPLAIAWAFRRAAPLVLRLAAVLTLVYYAVISLSQVGLARYFTPLTPLLALLIADLVVGATAVIGAPRGRAAARVALTALLVAAPLAASVAYDRIASETDTRVLATRWMAAHLPSGAVVARFGSHVFQIADPDLPPRTRAVDTALGDVDLDAAGVTYVVTHEHPLPFSRPSRKVLEALAPRLTLLAEFTPWSDGPAGRYEELDAYYVPFYDFAGVVRPGPDVRIYRLAPPAAERP